LKRFVKIGGEMISLPALESVLNHRWPSSDDKPLMAVESKEVEGERPELILFSVLEKITPDDANKALKEAGFGNIASISRVITIPEMPLLGTGKTDYRSLKSKIN
ncbi:2-acyl-glycerophospho-ethanolamine acyltransferase, partial [bacterium]|nr:2-acyl-glycerophospho-ethanolamine acyltransferase [bacterium]